MMARRARSILENKQVGRWIMQMFSCLLSVVPQQRTTHLCSVLPGRTQREPQGYAGLLFDLEGLLFDLEANRGRVRAACKQA